jgi:hypothetical protein
MPMVKSRKITPTSAAKSTVARSSTIASCSGPMITPAIRKPMIGTTLARTEKYPMTAAATTSAAVTPRKGGGPEASAAASSTESVDSPPDGVSMAFR